MRGFNYMKKISCVTFICFTMNNKAGFLWIMLLHSCTYICTRRDQWSQNGFSHPAENMLWPMPPDPYLVIFTSECWKQNPKAADECWLFCSAFAQCFSIPDTDCPIRLSLGSVLTAQWATSAENGSVALWGTLQHQESGPAVFLLIAWAR